MTVPATISFGEILRWSLWHMQRESPRAYGVMCRQAPAALTIVVDGEPAHVSFSPGRAEVRRAALPAPVYAETTRTAILDRADGRVSLTSAILEERLFLRGDVQALLRCHDAFVAYLNGAVRSPSLPPLLRRYREGQL